MQSCKKKSVYWSTVLFIGGKKFAEWNDCFPCLHDSLPFTTDCFEVANEYVRMVGKKVFSINEDKYGALWLTTDQALVRIDDRKGGMNCFTEKDGLPSISFMPNATFSYDD